MGDEDRLEELPDGNRPNSPRPLPWLQLLLFAVTTGTLFIAGSTFWSAVPRPGDDAHGALGRLIRDGGGYGCWVVAILLAHEMGHYLACRYYRVPASLPYFLPSLPPIGTFGAVIRIRGAIPHRRALFDIAAAGPIAGFLVALPALALGLARSEPFEPGLPGDGDMVIRFGRPVATALLRPLLLRDAGEIAVNGWYGAGWVGMLVTSLNLFPVGQLDGGHAAYAISPRLHRILSRGTPLLLAAIVAVQSIALGVTPAYIVWIAILIWMRDRHPPILDESVPLGGGRKLVAVLLVVIFALCFVLVPIRILEF